MFLNSRSTRNTRDKREREKGGGGAGASEREREGGGGASEKEREREREREREITHSLAHTLAHTRTHSSLLSHAFLPRASLSVPWLQGVKVIPAFSCQQHSSPRLYLPVFAGDFNKSDSEIRN